MDFNNLLKQAEAMSKEIEKSNKQISEKEFEGTASNGLVKVIITGDYKVKNITISPDIINVEDKEMLEDIIVLALNNALEQIEKSKNESLGSITAGFNFPGI